jgi:hypothetical protein
MAAANRFLALQLIQRKLCTPEATQPAAAPKAALPASRPNMTRTTLLENPRADVFNFTADAAFKEAPGATHDYDQLLIALAPTAISLEIGGKTTTAWKRGERRLHRPRPGAPGAEHQRQVAGHGRRRHQVAPTDADGRARPRA